VGAVYRSAQVRACAHVQGQDHPRFHRAGVQRRAAQAVGTDGALTLPYPLEKQKRSACLLREDALRVFIDNNRIRFNVGGGAAERKGLKISYQLLTLAAK